MEVPPWGQLDIDLILLVSERNRSPLNQGNKDRLYSDMAVASLGMFRYHEPMKI